MTRKLLLALLFLTVPAIAQNADLALSLQAYPAQPKVAIGETVELVLTIDNEGPDVAKNMRATVTIAPGDTVSEVFAPYPEVAACTREPNRATCNFGDVPQGTHSMHVRARMPIAVGTVEISASVTSDVADPNPGNNLASRTIETENRTSYWVRATPALFRVDPGASVALKVILDNNPATLPGTRFFVHLVAINGTIEKAEGREWACEIDGSSADCVIASPVVSCCEELPIDVIVRTNPSAEGGEARLTIDVSSDVPGEFFGQAGAIIQLYRHIAVTSTADAGPGTLRAAFAEVNEFCATRPCKVAFAIPPPVPDEGWFTIAPETPLPVIRTERVILDGTTQTQLTGDTNPNGPEIAIDGRTAGEGIEIHATCNGVIMGLAIGNFMANQGLWLTHDRQPCRDATQFEDRMLITENFIGTDPSGITPWPNLRGLRLDDSGAGVTGNIIANSRYSGVWLWHGAAWLHDNAIENNGASGIFIGPEVGYAEVLHNTISGHGDMGVAVARGAYNVDIRQNSMRDNAGLGIDWGLDGVSPIVEDDRGGANPPVLFAAVYDAAKDETIIGMTLQTRDGGAGGNMWVIDVYANDGPDGDGETFLGERLLYPPLPAGGFEVRVRGNHAGKWLNATSTRARFWGVAKPGDPRTESFGGGDSMTSELSNAVLATR